jgi:enoyl-CoA hydratase/carnithine racemase
MNEPGRRNPLNTGPGGSEQQVAGALVDLEEDDSIRAVVITGAGSAFSAGADARSAGAKSYSIDEIIRRTVAEPNEPDETRSWALWAVLDRYSKPLIAAVNGHAVGAGWEIAMWCDVVYADENAKFALTQINLGYLPVFASLFMTRTAGLYKTSELALSARFIDAAEAESLGMITRVVPAGTALEEARRFAEEVSERPPLVLSMVKTALRRGLTSQGEWRANQRDFVLMGMSDQAKAERNAWRERFTGSGT